MIRSEVLLASAYSTEHQILPQASWSILDTEEEWQRFSQPAAGNQSAVQSSLLLDGLHCAACSGIIERGLSELPGVLSVRVSLSKKRASVIWLPELTKPSKILAAVTALGYSANPASQLENTNLALKQQRTAFWRWMVAGFCMMQVMMYAGANYFTSAGEIAQDTHQLLSWASWLLTLPVLLFSCQPFFSHAFTDLKLRRVSMDLPVAIGIAITFVVSTAATFEPKGWWGSQVYFDSLTMFVFFLLSARFIEAKLHTKTLGALEGLVSRIPESIERKNTDNTFTRVLNSHLKVGDIARVHLGEAFPADGQLLSAETSADESLLTGESTPVHKNLGDVVVAGSYNLGATVEMRVDYLGESTQYGQIVKLINQAATEKPRLSQIADRIATPFLVMVMFSAALAAALLWSTDKAQALMTAAAVLIVTCPCALSLATPAAMLASASAFVKRGILIRRLQAIESISEVDTVIFDKTGTLTSNHIKVCQIESKAGLSRDDALTLAAAVAEHSKHPIARALFAANPNIAEVILLENVKETVGAGISATMTGWRDLIGEIKLGSAQFCATSVTDTQLQAVYLANQDGWLATFHLEESAKPEAKETIAMLKALNLNVELLSGDQSYSVARTAGQLGIVQYQAACSPQDKLMRLQALKKQGKKILMVGDGLNDGPILASAHASIAMGKGVPLTLAQADYILLSGDISQIPFLLKHAKKSMRIIQQNIIWAVVYNVVCIPLAFFGVLTAWMAGLGMAMSSLFVIVNALRLGSYSDQLSMRKSN